MNRTSFASLFLLSLLLVSKSASAVGGYTQIIILNNQSDSELSLSCKGGAHVTREKALRLAPRRSGIFLSDSLVDRFQDLLGGTYNCKVSLGNIRNHSFKTSLVNAQEIAVWKVDNNLEQSRTFECDQEYMGNFNRPSQILEELNSGKNYSATQCRSIELDS